MNKREDITKQLEDIAIKILGIPQFEARLSDSLDFHEVYCGSVERAMLKAYELGKKENE